MGEIIFFERPFSEGDIAFTSSVSARYERHVLKTKNNKQLRGCANREQCVWKPHYMGLLRGVFPVIITLLKNPKASHR
jgi:hypothetical protein